MIPEKSKVIKRFFKIRTYCTVYMEELQYIQDFFSYTLSQNQWFGIQIFTDNQAALQTLKNPNKGSTLQIMQKITQHKNNLRVENIPIHLQQIPAHKNMKGNKEVDIAAKKAIGQRTAKRNNGKLRKQDLRYTTEKRELDRAKATIKLALEQKILKYWEEAQTRQKKDRELYVIYIKSTKQVLKIYKGLRKDASALVVQL